MRQKLLARIVVVVGLVAASLSGTTNGVTAPGLVAAYSFDEGAGNSVLDASGSGLTGVVNGATWSPQGKFGNALSFNGTNARVDITDAAPLHLTNGMTLETWVKPAALANWREVILKERPNGLSYALYASDPSSKPNTYVSLGGADRDATATTALPLNSWSHLAATYDGATLRLIVNGTQVASQAVTGNLTASTGALRIGGNSLWGEWFSGLIDEVRIYNRALTAAEVTTDMNAAVGAGVPGRNLVAHHRDLDDHGLNDRAEALPRDRPVAARCEGSGGR
ncbi:MAG: LamG domain-containing protein [Pseudonocardiales bacterium]|nr:LamG domain-containing protein [Pseudonocardiales bacterium]